MFGLAIIVYNNGATAKVNALAHVCIAYIGQMRKLCAVADVGIFNFNKIAQFYIFTHNTVRTHICERANCCAGTDFAV